MKATKIIMVSLLCVAAVVMGYFCVMSVVTPISFENTRQAREVAVIQNLMHLRTAEVEFNREKGYFTADFDKVLFSADAFGKFGALDTDEDWACEARRYYFGIVGKYGAQVQSVLKKAAALDIKIICPLHGPWLFENIPYYLNLYDIWSSYGVESDGVVIAYTSVYGHTEKAVNLLKAELENKGVKVPVFDLARCDMAEAVEDAFRYGKLVLATTTYNADIFPFMRTFIEHLTERNYQNRTVGFMENGTWAPMAAKHMRAAFETMKNITLLDSVITIKSTLNKDSEAQMDALVAELTK